MSKAEKRACQYTGYCRNQSYKDYLNGYHQAEKDNELTWEDVRRIYLIVNSTINDVDMDNLTDKSIYQEVLKRFKAQKGEEV